MAPRPGKKVKKVKKDRHSVAIGAQLDPETWRKLKIMAGKIVPAK